MSGPEPASEVEAVKMANGSGSLPEDMSVEAIADKDFEEKNNGDEKKDGDENKDGDQNKYGEDKKDMVEKKETEENGMKKIEDEEAGKDEKKTEDVNTEEAEDVKMVDAEDLKTVETKDVKMVDEDARDEEDGVKEVGEEKGGADSKLKEVDDVKEDNENMEKKIDDNKVEGLKKRRASRQKVINKGEAKEKKERGIKSKELLSTPTPSSIDRPVRERKTVERLVEVIEKEPNKEFLVEKGRGTPLKDIPNGVCAFMEGPDLKEFCQEFISDQGLQSRCRYIIGTLLVAHKLARKKPADLKLLHQTLFGRKGKAVNFKNHILQFSGFVWHESDEKQRAKMKEKLDKYVKDTLLDICDLFDIPVSKATMRKEDLVAKLLDFMVAPHATTDVILADKQQQSLKSRKRKRATKGSASKSVAGAPTKRSRKKRTKREDSSNSKGKSVQENEKEDEEDNKDGISDEDEAVKQSECEAKESESEEAADEDEDDDNEDSRKTKEDKKRSSKQRGSVGKEKSKMETSSRKSSSRTTTKSPTKISSSKHPKAEDDKDVGAKVFSRKKRIVDAAREKSSLKSDKKEKTTGKRVARGKRKSMEAEYPSEEALRKTICEILKEVDFNTATFTDILKQLATHYKMDLAPRKPAIKELIQEELTKLADEAEDEDDEDAEKEENPEPSGKEVKT
ncbi:protein DEK [Cocos nucifera]|uniref:Protein DEK n=1 Tax=Cocos nucifera TaxID=13894 RepID=A0A8K0ICW4_COCNU|nr:protein DEK [Cocos nucifera]